MLKSSLFVCALIASPAWACPVCETELNLVPNHVGCLKAKIDVFIDQAKSVDPYLVNLISCNTDGPPPDGFEGMGSIPHIPSVINNPDPKNGVITEDLSAFDAYDLPPDYRPFVYVSHEQLVCVSTQLDKITEKPSKMTNFTLSGC